MPSDLIVQKLWLQRLQLEKGSKYTDICDDHFERDDYIRKAINYYFLMFFLIFDYFRLD